MGNELLTALTSWMTLAVSVLVPVTLAWIVYQTQSSYVLKVRVWKLVNGKVKSKDPDIQGFFDEQEMLMFFRFTQTDADDTADMKRYIQWSKHTGIPLWMVRKSKNYFDKEKLCIKDGDVKVLGFNKFSLRLLSTVFLLGAMMMFFVFITPQAIIRLNASGQWLSLGADNAHVRFKGKAEALTKSECNSLSAEEISGSKFQLQDAKILCDGWKAPGGVESFVETNVSGQRKVSGWLLLVLIAYASSTWLGASRAQTAQEVHRRLESKQKDAPTDGTVEV